ncbi:thiolase family protein [Sedimenticola selenatireducens]|uniref:Thiolase family protein n=1 Tax=Sedimenticola selenatireducens TaxID=191960 RepID=A0A558DYN1_9GAMM|nr:thiolase family protein [Sedimenticola selenatireducens]TVO68178.1 thiolase family protein [Sedimenticola selenatireducens]TVT66176.1 MAG: thiolase family protein [Sedimenticola selenatireducens]
MKNIVIAGYARTPFTLSNKGALAKTRPDDLAAAAIKGLVERSGVDVESIEDLILGNAFPEGEQGFNMARLVVFLSGLPISVGGATVNRFCGSSMQAIHQAAGAITMGAGEVYICAGVESMTRVPMAGFNPMPNPQLAADMPGAYMGMGETAENLARKYSISRADQEAFAVTSHEKAAAAQAAGRLSDEIVAVSGVDQDGCIRPETTLESLAGLRLAFDENGSVTAGTSSPLTDGASAVLVCSEDYARANGLDILAKIRSFAISGCAPDIMGIGPVISTQKALKRAGLTMADIDIIELNEAFASQSLACVRDLEIDLSKTNLDGGAIALGHPLGATGARITGKAAALLKREGKQFALATQCIGGGQGIATILEAI